MLSIKIADTLYDEIEEDGPSCPIGREWTSEINADTKLVWTEFINGFGCSCHPYYRSGWGLICYFKERQIGRLSIERRRLSYRSKYRYYIQDLNVYPEMRRRGFATLLLKEALSQFPQCYLEVLQNNKVARKLYRKLGFKMRRASRSKKIINFTSRSDIRTYIHS